MESYGDVAAYELTISTAYKYSFRKVLNFTTTTCIRIYLQERKKDFYTNEN